MVLAGLGFACELTCVGLACSGRRSLRGCSGLLLEPISPELGQKSRSSGKIPPVTLTPIAQSPELLLAHLPSMLCQGFSSPALACAAGWGGVG